MRHRHTTALTSQPDVLALAAATWLACGVVLLGLTPLPLHDATLGWSTTFWLLAAPCLLLLANRMRLPMALPAISRCRTVSGGGLRRMPSARRRNPRNRPSAAVAIRGARSPDGAKRNPGRCRVHAPDSDALRLHPGYVAGGPPTGAPSREVRR